MPERLNAFAEAYGPEIEARLRRLCPRSSLAGAEKLNEALIYAISSGGKRVRPLLCLLAAGVLRTPAETALEIACGVEFLHLSSVILDDLPAMDDAKTRRHRPALHVAYGEAVAILAAMALYAEAFSIFAPWPPIVREAAQATGCNGMTGGQAADLNGPGASRFEKTTALMRFALTAGGMAGQADAGQLDVLARFGALTGEAYQICDDLLDALGSERLAGKTVGQDVRHGKRVFAPGFGIEEARRRMQGLIAEAVRTLRAGLPPCGEADALCEFAGGIVERAAVLVENTHVDTGGGGRAAGAGGGECGVVAAGPGPER